MVPVSTQDLSKQSCRESETTLGVLTLHIFPMSGYTNKQQKLKFRVVLLLNWLPVKAREPFCSTIYKTRLCGSWKNIIQGRFNEVTLPAYKYAYLHARTCVMQI